MPYNFPAPRIGRTYENIISAMRNLIHPAWISLERRYTVLSDGVSQIDSILIISGRIWNVGWAAFSETHYVHTMYLCYGDIMHQTPRKRPRYPKHHTDLVGSGGMKSALGPIHKYPDFFLKRIFFIRFGLSSTQRQYFWSPKRKLFAKGLKSGSF